MVISEHSRVRLLDVEPDLGADLDATALEHAAAFLRLPALRLAPGPWGPDDVRDVVGVQGAVIGCIVVSGLITRDVHLGDRICTHLHGPRDFVSLNALDFASLPFDVHLGALSDAEVVVLDDRLLAAGQRWPRIIGRLFDMATAQLGRQSADQAISQLPRVEDRIVALFWQLANRWGRVRPEGVVFDLPLTHRALGRLVGAQRSTVSLGLQSLAADGRLVRRRDGSWILCPDLERVANQPAAGGGAPHGAFAGHGAAFGRQTDE